MESVIAGEDILETVFLVKKLNQRGNALCTLLLLVVIFVYVILVTT